MWETIGIWVGAGLTLCIYSFLYKDNPFFKFAEHIYVGVSTGYLICMAYFNALQPLLINPLGKNQWIVLVPGILGVMLYSRFIPKIAWISRYTLAFIIGAGAGISAPNVIQGYLLRHVGNTIQPLVSPTSSSFVEPEAIIVFIVVISIMVYFFFSVERKGILKPTARIGIISLMVYFGGAFGYTVMGRVSLAIGRIRYLLVDWLGIGF